MRPDAYAPLLGPMTAWIASCLSIILVLAYWPRICACTKA